MAEQQIDDEGRPEPILAGDEVVTLVTFLDYQRATLEWKTRGLTTEQLRQRIPSSAMTLGGLLGHLAWVESFWLEETVAGQPAPEPWGSIDFEADDDADWTLGVTLEGDELRSLWVANVERSRAVVEGFIEQHGADALGTTVPAWGGREHVAVRWVLTHMIEEYARHNGHADILREAVDGETGE